jgi:Glycine cleavage system H protein (lipoate-binding)
VKEVNSNVLQKPRMINDDPYGAGWLVKMTPSDPNQVALLKSAQEAKEAFSKKIKELRIRCYAAFPDIELYEIGIECSAVLAKLNDALSRLSVGSVVLLVTDDPTSEIEMVRWAKQTGQQLLEKRRNDNLYHFIVKKVV